MNRLKRGVVIDWETSGLLDDRVPSMSYLEGPQGIEIGAAVVDLDTWDELATFHRRIRFMGTHLGQRRGGPLYEKLTWSVGAERIHGITISALANEAPPATVGDEFLSFIRANTLSGEPVLLIGYNPSFDAYFVKQLLFFTGRLDEFRLLHRMVDVFTAGFLAYGCFNSDELFQLVNAERRNFHSAVEDVRLTISAMRSIIARTRTAGFGSESAIKLSAGAEARDP